MLLGACEVAAKWEGEVNVIKDHQIPENLVLMASRNEHLGYVLGFGNLAMERRAEESQSPLTRLPSHTEAHATQTTIPLGCPEYRRKKKGR